MSTLTVTTNNHPRHVIDAYELTPKERAEFDYLDWAAIDAFNDSATFFRYKGQLYDLSEFSLPPTTLRTQGWDGFQSDSFFSGIAIRYTDDYESVIVGLVLA